MKIKRFCKLGILFAVLCAVLAASAAPASARRGGDAPQARVMLSSSGGPYTITIASGAYDLVAAEEPDDVLETYEEGDSITFDSPDTADGFRADSMLVALPQDEDCLFRFGGVTYRGAFQTARGDAYYAVNLIDVEQYLYGVVGRELGYNYSLDATAAQAVAARSYAIASISDSNRYYDLTNTTSSQVYGGYSAETAFIREAVDETRGYVVMHDNEAVLAYYSSNAGGHTEDIDNIWHSDEVPIRGVASSWDALAGDYSAYGASCYAWTVTYTPAQLVELANAYGDTDIGAYQGITLSTTYQGQSSVSGRAMSVTISGSRGSVTATKDNIRSLLNIDSTLIEISDTTGEPVAAYVKGRDGKLTAWQTLTDLFVTSGNGAMRANGSSDKIYVATANGVEALDKSSAVSDVVVISGKGNGHGVGMSQWGAIAMGDAGYGWEEIIEHYYCQDRSITLDWLY